ncbi:hypothetical protein MKEN_00554900 [Mycena kentingensis (nom. inval.)]|nr:hypothetical protein MKEN_00554900 [Mycena kentingensis (nom. inval.)]
MHAALPEELFLEIISHLYDADLLALGAVSKSVLTLVVGLHLRRNAATLADAREGVLRAGTLSGAVHALRIAHLPALRAVDLEFRNPDKEALRRDIEALPRLRRASNEFRVMLRFAAPLRHDMTLILHSLVQPRCGMVACISASEVAIARVGGALVPSYDLLGPPASPRSPRPAEVSQYEFRRAIARVVSNPGRISAISVTARAGRSVLVLDPHAIATLVLPETLHLLPDEGDALLGDGLLTVPSLRMFGMDAKCFSAARLFEFFARHPRLEQVKLRRCRARGVAADDERKLLPRLRVLEAAPSLVAALLSARKSCRRVEDVAIHLDETTEDERTATRRRQLASALQAIATRCSVSSVSLHVSSSSKVLPWETKADCPRMAQPHVSELNIYFNQSRSSWSIGSSVPKTGTLAEWFRGWTGLRVLRLYGTKAGIDRVERLAEGLRREVGDGLLVETKHTPTPVPLLITTTIATTHKPPETTQHTHQHNGERTRRDYLAGIDITRPSMRRLTHRGGAKRTSTLMYQETRGCCGGISRASCAMQFSIRAMGGGRQ